MKFQGAAERSHDGPFSFYLIKNEQSAYIQKNCVGVVIGGGGAGVFFV